ncbi:MAG: integral rane protein MviN [Myxococcales bacterium]|nr:integral rane protein MviN [Myxococcales bacterium]
MPAASTGQKIGFATALLVLTVLLSRLLGFLRDAVIAALFGATGQTDAFYAAFTIPDFLNYIVAGGTLSITLIPIYTRHLEKDDEPGGNHVLGIIATIMALVVIAGIVVLEYLTPQITARYLHRLRKEDLDLAISLTRILLPAQLFFYLGGLAAATLFSRRRFVAVSLAPLVYNLGTIVGGALFGRRYGITSLAWGTLAGAIVGPFGIMFVAAWRAGLRYRPSLALRHPEFREWLYASIPLMLGVSLVMADDWIMRYFAAANLGAISCLNYARKLVQVPIAVAGQAVGQASMPFFASLHARGERVLLGERVTSSARASAAVSALAACGLAAVAVPAVDLLFRRGHFAAWQVLPTAQYVAGFALAIPLWAMQGILARAFYACGDTLTPMVAGTVVTLVSLPIYWLGFRTLGPTGLVIASDCGILMHTASLLVLLPRRLDTVNRANLIGGTLRALAVGAIAALPTWGIARYVPHGRLQGHALGFVQLAVGGLVFVAIAALLARPFGATDLVALFDRVLRRRRSALPSPP